MSKTVLDASAILAVLFREPGAEVVEAHYPIFNMASDYTLIINRLQRQKPASGTTNALKPAIEGSQTIILRTPPGAGSMPRAS